MNQNRIIKGLLLILGVISLQSCDKDFSTVGGNVIGDGNLGIDTYNVQDIIAYNQAYGAMDTKNLMEIPLGALKSDLFGDNTSSIVTQLSFDKSAFDGIGDNAKIDSVYVYIPYFSEFDKTEENTRLYKLNNVYGNASFNLEVYQNGYYMNSANINDGEDKKYYSDNATTFDSNIVSPLLNNKDASQNTSFSFKNTDIVIPQYDKEGNIIIDEATGKPKAKMTLTPGMWLDLDKNYFQEQWINKKEEFIDEGAFKDIFRGLYFKATSNSTPGAIGLLQLSKGQFVIKYTFDSKSKDKEGNEVITSKKATLTLNFVSNAASGNPKQNGNVATNLFHQTPNQQYTDAISAPNKKLGDEKLYVKGNEGSLAVVELFKDNNGEELQKLRDMDILINDAILTVYVDKSLMKNQANPPRLQLYNYDNQEYVADFAFDSSTIGNVVKPYYGGFFEKEDLDNNKEGFVYRIRISQHIMNLIKNKEAKNSKLALIVANEYNTGLMGNMTFKSLKNDIPNTPTDIKIINPFTIGCPIGTVLYGTNGTDSKTKMKLQIFYTKR